MINFSESKALISHHVIKGEFYQVSFSVTDDVIGRLFVSAANGSNMVGMLGSVSMEGLNELGELIDATAELIESKGYIVNDEEEILRDPLQPA